MSAIPGAEPESRNFQPSSTRQLFLPSVCPALAWNLRVKHHTGRLRLLSLMSAGGHPCSGIPMASHIGF